MHPTDSIDLVYTSLHFELHLKLHLKAVKHFADIYTSVTSLPHFGVGYFARRALVQVLRPLWPDPTD